MVGQFGEVFNLTNWRVCRKLTNLKTAKHCDIALCACDRYRLSPNLKYVLKTDSAELILMLAKFSRYTVCTRHCALHVCLINKIFHVYVYRESPRFTFIQRLRQIHLFFTDYPRWFSRRMSFSLNTRPKACYPQSFEVWHTLYVNHTTL